MSWSRGVDRYGKEVGYAIETDCQHSGCTKKVDKGLGCRCGGVTNLREDFGCGNFFCGEHLYLNFKDQLCPKCFEEEKKRT